jgi:Flp pilus assembly protein TadB
MQQLRKSKSSKTNCKDIGRRAEAVAGLQKNCWHLLLSTLCSSFFFTVKWIVLEVVVFITIVLYWFFTFFLFWARFVFSLYEVQEEGIIKDSKAL